MNFDLLEIFNSTLGSPFIGHASAQLGESEDTTRTAIRSIGPTLLTGLMQRAATPASSAEIFRDVTDPQIDAGIAARLPGLLANRGSLESLQGLGESLSGLLFGGRTGSVTNAIAAVSGVRPNSAMMLLSIGAPLLFGIVKKYVANNDLDAAALSSLLLRQQRSVERSGLDNRIAGALGFGSVSELLASLPVAGAAATAVPEVAVKRPSDRTWLPWAMAAGIAVFGFLFFVNHTADNQEMPRGAVQVAEVPGDVASSEVAPADSAKVYFGSGEASIDGEDRMRIASVAQSAKSADRPVGITGYADRTGDEDLNRELAKDRAWAVRDALVDEGVQESRIVMDPPRSVTGSGNDDEARRVDIGVR